METNSIKSFSCEICEKNFSSSAYKKQHIGIVHEEEKKFICNICSSSFGSKTELSFHIENNHQGEHHACKCCGKVFARSGGLEKHIKAIHESQRNYKCDSCGKSFNLSGPLKKHINIIHKGQKITNVILVENPLLNQDL